MFLHPIPHTGSFQILKNYQSENPLEEAWARVSRYGILEYLKAGIYFKNELESKEISNLLNYAMVRVRQSVEFRSFSKNSSILTAPLALYYSFLNLTRAFLAIGPGVIPYKSHGLRFKTGADILSSYAILDKGTFTDYLTAYGYEWKKGTKITLLESFKRIIEIAGDLTSIKNQTSYVVPIRVESYIEGPTYLNFKVPIIEFDTKWVDEFPSLAEICEIRHGHTFTLQVKKEFNQEKYRDISKLINKHLLPNLIFSQNALWFLIREVEKSLVFPRSAYYLVALFILASIVRYEPELLLEINPNETETGWLINKFLKKSERFFPQLKISELFEESIYF